MNLASLTAWALILSCGFIGIVTYAGTVKKLAVRSQLRGDATYDAEPVALLDAGTEVEVLSLEDEGEWYWVRAHGKEGWLHADSLNSPSYLPLKDEPEPEGAKLLDVHYLVRLKRYPFVEGSVLGGTSNIRAVTGQLLHPYYQVAFRGGYGWRWKLIENRGVWSTEGLGSLLVERFRPFARTVYSFEIGVRERYLQTHRRGYSTGLFMGANLRRSGWSTTAQPLTRSPHSIVFPFGFTASWEGDSRRIWIFDTGVMLGKYSGLLLQLESPL